MRVVPGVRILVVGLVVLCVGLVGQGLVLAAGDPASPGAGSGSASVPGHPGAGVAEPLFDPGVAPVGWLVDQHSGLCLQTGVVTGPSNAPKLVVGGRLQAVGTELAQCSASEPTQVFSVLASGQLQVRGVTPTSHDTTTVCLLDWPLRHGSWVGNWVSYSSLGCEDAPDQMWDIDDHGHVKNRGTGRCLDVFGGKKDAGSFVGTYECGGAERGSSQNFVFVTRMTKAASLLGLPLINPLSAKCLDAPVFAEPAQISACDADRATELAWSFDPDTQMITRADGVGEASRVLCLGVNVDVKSGRKWVSKYSKDAVLADDGCGPSNGSDPYVKWEMHPDGLIESVGTRGKCLDVKNARTQAGTEVRLVGCKRNGAGAAQRWTQISMPDLASVDHQGRSKRSALGECQATGRTNIDGTKYVPRPFVKEDSQRTHQVGPRQTLITWLSNREQLVADGAKAYLFNLRLTADADACATIGGIYRGVLDKFGDLVKRGVLASVRYLCYVGDFLSHQGGPARWDCRFGDDSESRSITAPFEAVRLPRGEQVDVQVVVPAQYVAGANAAFGLQIQASDGHTGSVNITQSATLVGHYANLTAAEAAAAAQRRFYAWGENRSGQIGDGTTEPRPAPVLVQDLQGLRAPVDVVGSGLEVLEPPTSKRGTTMAVLRDGRIYAWGSNGTAQAGQTPASSVPNGKPTRVPGVEGVLSEPGQIALGGGSAYAIAGGQPLAWGYNASKQLCRAAPQSDPERDYDSVVRRMTLPSGFSLPARKIVAAALSVYVMDADYKIWACGRNVEGQLCLAPGQRDQQHVDAPVPSPRVASELAPVGVVAEQDAPAWRNVHPVNMQASPTSLVVQYSNGQVAACGVNKSGVVDPGAASKDGDSQRLKLVAIGAAASALAHKADGVLAVTGSNPGNVTTWGTSYRNSLGQGQAALGVRRSPGVIKGLSGITGVAASLINGFGLGRNGEVFSWGASGPALGRVNGLEFIEGDTKSIAPGVIAFGGGTFRADVLGSGNLNGYAVGILDRTGHDEQ